ncbi:MAG: DUF4185 domain-containing protein [Treponema sp.]|nr:DUF4185 domain-containing protein [Treponema sp.]
MKNDSHPGEFIRLKPLRRSYAALCNNSGMNGAAAGRVHCHSNDAKDMCTGKKKCFIFDAGRIDQLGQLHIWNHNSGDGSNGLKNITVSYSENNKNYTDLGVFTLKRADGSAKLPATNCTDGSFINFNGLNARYIKITPIDNYGGGRYGLSEIKLFRYRHAVYKGAYIAASPLYNIRTTLPKSAYYNLTNGAGLSDPVSPAAVHDNNSAHMFFVKGNTGVFEIDLHGRYPVEKIVIWNYNGAGKTRYGLKNITVQSADNNIGSWTTRVTSAGINPGTGQNGLEPSAVIPVDFTARFIRISGPCISGAQSGLSAIRCYIGSGMFADYLPDLTALLFNYTPEPGWSGADGIYAVNLDGKDYDSNRKPEDKKTFFIFSDTLTQPVNPVTGRRFGPWGMQNNTYATLAGGIPASANITYDIERIKPFPEVEKEFYWMADGFVWGGKVNIFTIWVNNKVGGPWGFKQIGVDLLKFTIKNGEVDKSSAEIIKDTDKNLADTSAGTSGDSPRWYLGSALFENTAEAGALNPDGFIYVYGYHDGTGCRRLIAARVRPADAEDFTKYEYLWHDNTWKNQAWGSSSDNMKFLSPPDENTSTEFSIQEVRSGTDKGKFTMVYSRKTFEDDWIRIASADGPAGNFSDSRQVFQLVTPFNTIPLKDQKDTNYMYAYNPKAHPALSSERELVISYNVNGGQGGKNADIFRPRFIRYAQVPDNP